MLSVMVVVMSMVVMMVSMVLLFMAIFIIMVAADVGEVAGVVWPESVFSEEIVFPVVGDWV